MTQFFNSEIDLTATDILDTDDPAVFETDNNYLPDKVPYNIRIGNEILKVTDVDTSSSSFVYTAERAQENTTAQLHSIGAPVAHVLTARGLTESLISVNEFPETGDVTSWFREGRVQNVTDKTVVDSPEDVEFQRHYFVSQCPVKEIGFHYSLGTFVETNLTGSSQVVSDSSVIKINAIGKTDQNFGLFTLGLVELFLTNQFTIGFQHNGFLPSSIGVCAFNDSDDKHVVCSINLQDAAPNFNYSVTQWTDFDTLHSTPVTPKAITQTPIMFLRVQLSGSDIVFSFSVDNIDYFELASVPDSFLATNRLGFAINEDFVGKIFHVE